MIHANQMSPPIYASLLWKKCQSHRLVRLICHTW